MSVTRSECNEAWERSVRAQRTVHQNKSTLAPLLSLYFRNWRLLRSRSMAQIIFPRLTKKWLLHPLVLQIDGEMLTVPSSCSLARQRGRSFGIKLRAIV